MDLLGLTFSMNLDKMDCLNFKSQLINGNLAFLLHLEKLPLVKTLLIPKLNPLFLSLPKPDNS